MNIPDAARAVEPEADGEALDSDPDPNHDVSDPDRDLAQGELTESASEADAESDGWSLTEWLLDTPEGSYREADARDYWDPENGGKHRLAFHISDLTGARGLPNAVGILIAGAEMYYNAAGAPGGLSSASGSSEESEADAEEESPDVPGVTVS